MTTPRHAHDEAHRPPSDCPVCGDQLAVTRLGCASCGTELAGVFSSCEFCALDAAEIETLRVFLASRGNLREVEKHLGVSYPTARLRLTQLLMRLGLSGDEEGQPRGGSETASGTDHPHQPEAKSERGPEAEAGPDADEVLAQVAAGKLTPAEAQQLLG